MHWLQNNAKHILHLGVFLKHNDDSGFSNSFGTLCMRGALGPICNLPRILALISRECNRQNQWYISIRQINQNELWSKHFRVFLNVKHIFFCATCIPSRKKTTATYPQSFQIYGTLLSVARPNQANNLVNSDNVVKKEVSFRDTKMDVLETFWTNLQPFHGKM